MDISEGNGALIDIKQRAIIVTKNDGKTVVCAEPSPDALSVYAAEAVATLRGKSGQEVANLRSELRETGSFTGLRTQTIQLMRDAMYRTCEAYANGGIDEKDYALLMRRYQRYMVAYLAVEQLTGTARVTTDLIGAKNISELRKKIRDRISGITAKLSELEKKLPKEQADEQNIMMLKEEKDLLEEVDRMLVIVPVSDAAAKIFVYEDEIPKHISGIVDRILGQDDAGYLCLIRGVEKGSSAAEYCSKIMNGKGAIQGSNSPQVKYRGFIDR